MFPRKKKMYNNTTKHYFNHTFVRNSFTFDFEMEMGKGMQKKVVN